MRPQLIRGATIVTMDRQGDIGHGELLVGGDTIVALGPQLAVLAGWIVLAFAVALRIFRWR